ncbi:MAG: hypothetical protein IAF02_26090, partial [Anaerolineae bacterium]|nr:hypothetical protein [Anaerolineae bacterium]
MATNQEIKDALNSYFSLGEINTLCFDLGIPYEEIKREGKMNTITSLIEYTGRTNQTGQLIAYINKARPHANLSPTVPEPIQADPFSSQPQGGNTFFFQGDYVGGDKLGGDKVGGDKISTSNTFNMSGNFSGAILNINSTLKNVNQTIGALPRADEDAKAALQQLITELQTALQQV